MMIAALYAALLLSAPSQGADTACIVGRSVMPGRGVINLSPQVRARSPLDSVTLRLGDGVLKVCYGRPSARGRTMIGGADVPFGRIWRTGANEATMLHVTRPVMIAGIHVEPGSYSLYTVPGEREWEIIVNRSYLQWGHESTYTDSVRAQEVGRGRVPVAATPAHVEQFTIRGEAGRNGAATLILEWERTRVAVPVTPMRR